MICCAAEAVVHGLVLVLHSLIGTVAVGVHGLVLALHNWTRTAGVEVRGRVVRLGMNCCATSAVVLHS